MLLLSFDGGFAFPPSRKSYRTKRPVPLTPLITLPKYHSSSIERLPENRESGSNANFSGSNGNLRFGRFMRKFRRGSLCPHRSLFRDQGTLDWAESHSSFYDDGDHCRPCNKYDHDHSSESWKQTTVTAGVRGTIGVATKVGDVKCNRFSRCSKRGWAVRAPSQITRACDLR